MPCGVRSMVVVEPHAQRTAARGCGLGWSRLTAYLALALAPSVGLLWMAVALAPSDVVREQSEPPREASLEPSAAQGSDAEQPPTLTVLTWGGVYEQAQRQALFEPFTALTGIGIEVVEYDGGLARLRQHHEAWGDRQGAAADQGVDVVDMTMSDTLAACREGLLRPLSHEGLPPAPDGTPAHRDFIDGAMTTCGLAHTAYATVIAYDRRAFPGIRPNRVADLFDLERFPGRRALQRAPFGNLEWALHAYGVPTADLYRLLSTRRGLHLALAKLEGIADRVVWWQDGRAPAQLLEQGDVVMATGYNGRFFAAMSERGAPIEILWDGQIQELENWTISIRSDNLDAAQRFIRYATSTEALTRFARHLPYGPTRRSASHRVAGHVDTGIDMQPHLPTHPRNDRNSIVKDVQWHSRTHDRIRQIFHDWIAALDPD